MSAGSVLEPGDGPAQLERALDVLARVDFDPDHQAPDPPVAREACVLVSVHPRPGYGDVFAVGPSARLEWQEGAEEAAADVA